MKKRLKLIHSIQKVGTRNKLYTNKLNKLNFTVVNLNIG